VKGVHIHFSRTCGHLRLTSEVRGKWSARSSYSLLFSRWCSATDKWEENGVKELILIQ